MHKVNNQETPRIFTDLIKERYINIQQVSKSNFCLKNVSLNITKYSMYFRIPKL